MSEEKAYNDPTKFAGIESVQDAKAYLPSAFFNRLGKASGAVWAYMASVCGLAWVVKLDTNSPWLCLAFLTALTAGLLVEVRFSDTS